MKHRGYIAHAYADVKQWIKFLHGFDRKQKNLLLTNEQLQMILEERKHTWLGGICLPLKRSRRTVP